MSQTQEDIIWDEVKQLRTRVHDMSNTLAAFQLLLENSNEDIKDLDKEVEGIKEDINDIKMSMSEIRSIANDTNETLSNFGRLLWIVVASAITGVATAVANMLW